MEGDERKAQLGAARYIAARFLARRAVDVDSLARFLPFWDAPSTSAHEFIIPSCRDSYSPQRPRTNAMGALSFLVVASTHSMGACTAHSS